MGRPPFPSIAIVGGGISGLATAYHLREALDALALPHRLAVLEASPRLGGVIRTERTGDYLVEGGPDTLLATKPAGAALCDKLGLAGDLATVAPRPRSVEILHRGRLVPVPAGFVMMAPTRLWPVLASPLFSPAGKIRMGLERFVPPSPGGGADESLAHFVTRRFGREVLERVAEPIIAGLFIAEAERMSLRAVMPRFLDMERGHGSVTRALARGRAAARNGHGLFTYLRAGLESLVHGLKQRLAGEELRTGTAVRTVARGAGSGRWTLRLSGGEKRDFDAVVLACPAYAARDAVAPVDPRLAGEIGGLSYASCATVSLVYARAAVRRPLQSLGFFVPRVERRPLLACSYMSEKFEGRVPRDEVMVRAFVGGRAQREILDRDDHVLVSLAHEQLDAVLGLSGRPRLARVHRFPDAMPQYEVGWLDRLAAIRDRLADHPGLFVAGSVAGAVGIPDCISSAAVAARAVTEHLAAVRTDHRYAVR